MIKYISIIALIMYGYASISADCVRFGDFIDEFSLAVRDSDKEAIFEMSHFFNKSEREHLNNFYDDFFDDLTYSYLQHFEICEFEQYYRDDFKKSEESPFTEFRIPKKVKSIYIVSYDYDEKVFGQTETFSKVLAFAEIKDELKFVGYYDLD